LTDRTKSAEITRPGSQYCVTRRSSSNPRTRVNGAAMSLFNTGSQTTSTRRCASGNSASNWSSAEAPRTQTGQVGESMAKTRTSPSAALKASRNMGREPEPNVASGGCPGGTRRGASFSHANAATDTTTAAIKRINNDLNARPSRTGKISSAAVGLQFSRLECVHDAVFSWKIEAAGPAGCWSNAHHVVSVDEHCR